MKLFTIELKFVKIIIIQHWDQDYSLDDGFSNNDFMSSIAQVIASLNSEVEVDEHEHLDSMPNLMTSGPARSRNHVGQLASQDRTQQTTHSLSRNHLTPVTRTYTYNI